MLKSPENGISDRNRKNKRCGLIGGGVPQGVGSEVSKAPTRTSLSLSLSPLSLSLSAKEL